MYLYPTFTIDWVEVIDTHGRVRMSYAQKINDPSVAKLNPEPATLVELWCKVDGQWYRDITAEQSDAKGSH